ncbi:hypothetical protein GGF46_002905 [Coemansia sp. RSA 552]|nr:hypothetical protein GGF46_002905 [Coemansia sp. RSA 552]
MSDTAFRPLPLVLPKADFMHLQELSTRLKTIREPVRELARVATAGGSSTADTAVPVGDPAVSAVLLARLRDQLDITQRLMHEYLASICGDKAVLSRRPNSSGRVSLNRGPGSSDRKSINRISTSSTSTTRSRSDTQDSNGMPSGRAARPQSLYVAATDRGASAVPEALVAVPLPASVKTEAGRKPTSADAQSSAGPTAAMQRTASLTRPLVPVNTIENAIARMWRCGNGLALAPARAVNEIGVRLGQRHMTPLEERIPSIPSRALAGNAGAAPIDIVDLVNSLFRSSMCENEASLLTKRIETIPPGVVACAIANSSSQLFEQLTADLISRYATASDDATGAHSVLRMLSDHANFLTRLVETTIAYPIHAAQRARRIEWWTAVVCLIRELGDYESLSSLVCVFSGAVVGRLHDTWELVSPQCKAAIRFILDTVLKIHPNYASYRDELRQRIKRQEALKRALAASQNKAAISAALGVSTNTTALEESSLDFDSAIAIATPDLCATDESYVNSCLFCKEAFELPPPRVLVPIVAVLLKDAVSAEAASSDKSTNRRSMRRKQTDPPMHWSTVMKHCRNTSLPLSLDYFMLRRIFATELSALPMLASAPGNSETQGPQARNSQPLSVGQGLLARGAMSTASSFLRRMPRRHSATSKDSAATEELSMANCRMLGAGQNVPTIVDILAHFLYIAAGNSCFSCSMGSLLEPLHVSTSAQLAIVVTSMMVFSEPWMPREYLMRLCDLREPRPQPSIQSASSFKSPPLPGASSDAVRGSRGAHSQGYESRSSERPWLITAVSPETQMLLSFDSRSRRR